MTLAEAKKQIAALKREVTATRNRLVKERDALRAVLDGVHEALGESTDSEDTELPKIIADVRAEMKRLDAERESVRARLATAQRAYAELQMVCEVEHAARMDAETARDDARTERDGMTTTLKSYHASMVDMEAQRDDEREKFAIIGDLLRAQAEEARTFREERDEALDALDAVQRAVEPPTVETPREGA